MTDRDLQNSIAIMCFAMVSIVGGAWTAHAVDGMLTAEQVEICHRSGSTDCPPLPR